MIIIPARTVYAQANGRSVEKNGDWTTKEDKVQK
jgi:hypothetical protein